VQLLESDGLKAVAGVFDLVLCNPPYVNQEHDSTTPEHSAEPFIA